MKVVIELDSADYMYIKNGCIVPIKIDNHIYDAIRSGTVLPKGHGRLIEEPTETDISNTVGGDNDFAECIRDSVKAVFDNATTIIEADMESNRVGLG